jgi:hypothetical protein
MCPACLRGTHAAGPDVIRRSGPNQILALDSARPVTGFPDLSNRIFTLNVPVRTRRNPHIPIAKPLMRWPQSLRC